jgi:hypothetical protein
VAHGQKIGKNDMTEVYSITETFGTTLKILEAYANYEFFSLVVYAPKGWGKSSFAIQLLSEVYGEQKISPFGPVIIRRNWNAWKDYMIFTPEQYEDKIDYALRKNMRYKCLVWDDAGAWASKHRWQEEWAKRFAEEYDTLRTVTSGLVLTTVNPRNLLTTVRNYDTWTGRIVKITGNPKASHLRRVRVYSGWVSPDLVKQGRRVEYDDFFSVRLPDRVFREYDPVRRHYVRILHERLIEARKPAPDIEDIVSIDK